MTIVPDANTPSELGRALRCDEICDRFEAAWGAAGTAGVRPALQDYLFDLSPTTNLRRKQLIYFCPTKDMFAQFQHLPMQVLQEGYAS